MKIEIPISRFVGETTKNSEIMVPLLLSAISIGNILKQIEHSDDTSRRSKSFFGFTIQLGMIRVELEVILNYLPIQILLSQYLHSKGI